jgi:predicted lipid-binding transport protein (Tim44 family)
MFAAFIVPFLGSLAGKLAMKLIGSVMNSSGEKPAGDASSASGFKDNFLSLLKAQPASQTQPAAATPGALAATDQANALALGRPSGTMPLPQGFGRQVVAIYVEHQAP